MQYEMTFIVFSEEKIKLVKDILVQSKATVLFENPMGRRNFAYIVKKQRAGIYHNLYFSALAKDLESINKALQTERDIARYLIIKNDENIDEIKAKIQRMKQKKETKKTTKDIMTPQIDKESKTDTDKQENKVSKKSKTTSEDVKPSENLDTKSKTVKSEKVKIEKSKNETKKTVSKAKKTQQVSAKAEKPSDDQDRIKKLEEKLDELLKD